MKGTKALNLSKELVKRLRPFSKKISVAGSIRRGSVHPLDVDIVIIPKDKDKLEEYMKKIGKFVSGGEHESTWRVNGVKVELYYTNGEEWGADLLAYSGGKGYNIGLRLVAKRKGLKLTQHGLFNLKTGRKIAGKSEKEIYTALGKRYKEPKERE